MSITSADSGSWPTMYDGQRRVMRELIVHGPHSRVEVARRLEASRASLSRITRELIDIGFVGEGALQYSTTRGRPSELLHVRADAAHFAGVKLTGTHLYAVVTDFAAEVVDEVAEPLSGTSPEGVAAQIAAVCGRLFGELTLPAAVGVCLAGNVRDGPDGQLVEQSHFLGWESAPLQTLVAERVGLPVTLANDVVALTGGHHWFGAGVGSDSLVVYGLGAGIGAGIVVHDEVYTGAHGRAGHVGHTRMPGSGRPCERGHTDCIHSFVTMDAICFNAGVGAEQYELALARAREGEPLARRAFGLAAEALGVVIAEVVNTVDPRKVLVTGEGVDMLELEPEAMQRSLRDHLEQVDPASVVIERPVFSFTQYARGAAVTAMRELF